ncbi:MAG: tetratricopeptide repeat protein, partial [Pyrinomonadaceae bacterium]
MNLKRLITYLIATFFLPFQLCHAQANGAFLLQEAQQLAAGYRAEQELKGGETQSYSILVEAGQFLHVNVEQKGIDVVATLVGGDGKPILKIDSPNSIWGLEPLIAIAETSGNYRIDVSSTNKSAAPGHYEIRVVALREAIPTDKEPVAADRIFWEANRLRVQRTAASSREAIEKFKQALSFFQSAGEQYRQALTLTLIGSIHAGLGEPQLALEHHEKVLPLFRILEDRIGQSTTLINIGGMHDVLGNLPKALDYFNQALSILEPGRALAIEATIRSNIGKVHSDLSNWHESLEDYHQALSIFRKTGEKRREGITLNNIGTTHWFLGQLDKALEYFQEALVLRRSSGDKAGEAQTLTNMGRVYAALGQREKALENYDLALGLQRTVGDRLGESNTLNQIGRLYAALNDHQKALGFYQQSLQLARDVGNRREEGIALNNIAHANRVLRQPQSSLDYHNQALKIFQSIGDRQHEADSFYGLALTESDLGNSSMAGEHVARALSLFEDVRSKAGAEQSRSSFLASKQDAYQFYIDLLMTMHRQQPTKNFDALALQTSERARARSLLEMLAESHADIRKGVNTELLERERSLTQQLNGKAQRQIQMLGQKGSQDRLAELNKEISALEDEYRQVQASIRESSPAYAALTQPQPVTLKEIQQQLDPNTLLLEYSLGDQRSYLWAVTANSIKSYELPKRELIQKSAREFYELLTTRGNSVPGEAAEPKKIRLASVDSKLLVTATELSAMVLGPVASELGSKRLVIVASESLQYVPFGALPMSGSESTASQVALSDTRSSRSHPRTASDARSPTYRPLILNHEIISLPSASAFALHRKNLAGRKVAEKAVAVIADPVFSNNDERLKADVRTSEPKRGQPNDDTSTRILEHLADDSTGRVAIRRLRFTRQEADQILAVTPRMSNLKA